MSHDGDDGCAGLQVVLVVLLLVYGVLHLGRHIFCREPELLGHDVDGLGLQSLVDAGHDADGHTGRDDLHHGHVHHRCQLADGDELGELEHLRLCCLGSHFLAHALGHGVALLLAVLGALLVLCGLRREACQRLLHLACHVLLAHLLYGLHGLLALLLLLSAGLLALLVAEVLVAALVLLLSAALLALLLLLLGSLLNVYAPAAYALALLLLAAALLAVGAALLVGLLLALLAFLLFRLLLRTGTLVQCREVNLSEHVHLRSQLLLALQGEYLALRCCGLCRLFSGFGLFRLWLDGGRLGRLGLGSSFNALLLSLHLLYFRLLGFHLLGLHLLLRLLGGSGLRCCDGGRRLLVSGLLCLGLHFRGFHHLGLFLFCGSRADGSSHGFRFLLRADGRGRLLHRLRLVQAAEVYLTQRLELLALHLLFSLGFHGAALGLRVRAHDSLLLRLLGEELVGLCLHGFIGAEGFDQRFILLVGDLGVRRHIVANLTQPRLVLQEINCRLKSYVQFG